MSVASGTGGNGRRAEDPAVASTGMASLWPQIEPLLDHVEKPARYIGGELGAVPGTALVPGPGIVSWLLVYPDTYEIGLPNQGLQILYEILNERPDALAERAYAPWVDMEAAMRAAGRWVSRLKSGMPRARIASSMSVHGA